MQIQVTAKTVNAGIDEALKKLDTTIDKIQYEVIQEPSKGFLGLLSKPAKIIVTLNEQEKITNEPISEKKIPRIISEDELKQEKIVQKERNEQKTINENAPEIAKQFLTEVFEKMKIDVEVNCKINEKNNLLIELKGEDIGVVIGKRGQTLDSLQYLVNLVVNKGEFSYMSVNIDTEDYRERRKKALENLAINLSKKVRNTNKSVVLEPMNPYERRIIHSKLQNDRFVKTYSEGEEPFRYVVIAPK